MKILLLAINAKYIHSSLALRSIKYYCQDYFEHIHLLETTINNHENEIIQLIYREKPDIIGISCYIWNMSLVKILVPTLKKILPNTTLILGGPEVSYEGENLLMDLGADFIMEGEGEAIWKAYLDYRFYQRGTLETIPGLIYRSSTGIVKTPTCSPLDLEKLPFVYEDLSDMAHKIIYYEASRGCPFSCQYCLSSINKGVRLVPLDHVKKHLQHFYNHQVKQVKFVDRTFNANKAFAMSIWKYLITHDNQYTNFHFEIAAELIDDELLALLKRARPGLIQFEIGVQSTNPQVLKAIKRNMSYEKLAPIIHKIQALGNIHQHLDLIAGLPLETYQSFKRSFNDVISLYPEQFQLGFLKVLKGSGLRANAKKYGLVYKEAPPYEILFTDCMTYDEILRLHSIEELLERYYNSGRFESILHYLFTCFKSPFDFFENFAIYWQNNGYDLLQHNKLAYYLKLIGFINEYAEINQAFCKELIRFDYLKHETLKEIPLELQTIEPTIYKKEDMDCLKDETYILTQFPHLAVLSPRQRYRKIQIERFKYPVYELFRGEEPIPLSRPCKILFDYSTSQVAYTLLNEEF